MVTQELFQGMNEVLVKVVQYRCFRAHLFQLRLGTTPLPHTHHSTQKFSEKYNLGEVALIQGWVKLKISQVMLGWVFSLQCELGLVESEYLSLGSIIRNTLVLSRLSNRHDTKDTTQHKNDTTRHNTTQKDTKWIYIF